MLKLSQDRLAELAQIPQPYVSKIELRRPDVHPDDVVAVAKVLAVDPKILMDDAQ